MRLFHGETWNHGEPIAIETIAASLARICRWGGHTKTWHSVAEHSVRVSWICGVSGLLHDAAEIIYQDMPSPVKMGLADYRAAIERLQNAIYGQFGVEVSGLLSVADQATRAWEYETYVTQDTIAWGIAESEHRFLEKWDHFQGTG